MNAPKKLKKKDEDRISHGLEVLKEEVGKREELRKENKKLEKDMIELKDSFQQTLMHVSLQNQKLKEVYTEIKESINPENRKTLEEAFPFLTE